MERFKPGDRVVVLPKFAHLYPDSLGTIAAVTPNQVRPVFTEYTVLFADGSTAHLFDFQLLEDKLGYRLVVADVVLDSSEQPVEQSSHVSGRRIVLRGETIDIDMTVSRPSSYASIVGQVLSDHPKPANGYQLKTGQR